MGCRIKSGLASASTPRHGWEVQLPCRHLRVCYSRQVDRVAYRGHLEREEAAFSKRRTERGRRSKLKSSRNCRKSRHKYHLMSITFEQACVSRRNGNAVRLRLTPFCCFFQLPNSLILFQKPLGRALFGIQFKLSGEAGACSHRKKPSLSHERCDRNPSTDVCVQFAKNSSSPRTFPPIIAGSREGTSSSLATYPPSACTRCNSILL